MNVALRVVVGLALLIVLLIGGAILWADWNYARLYGGHSPLVDRSEFQSEAVPTLIKNVSVLSRDGEVMTGPSDVFIENGIIKSVGPGLTPKPASEKVKIIDGTGQYLIPSLTDAHVHIGRRENDLLLYLANGVTQVRELSGSQHNLKMREQTNADHAGPDLYIASTKVFSDEGVARFIGERLYPRINAASAAEARRLAKSIAEDGYDAIKVSGFATREVYDALIEASAELDLDVIGYLNQETGLEGLKGGSQRDLAHIEELLKGLRIEYEDHKTNGADDFLAHVRERADSVAQFLKENNISVTTTVWLIGSVVKQKFALEEVLSNVELEYVDVASLEGCMLEVGWLPGCNLYEPSVEERADPERLERSKRRWEMWTEGNYIFVDALNRADVSLLAGTDVGVPVVVPGFSIHDELEALSRTLTNAQALQVATATPGRWLDNNTGIVATNYRANLLLLEENPLENITATRQITSVFKDGVQYDRQTLDEMLAAVAKVNNEKRSRSIDQYLLIRP